MLPEHLSDEQLTALRDGELHDRAVVEHVRHCVECSARLGDTKLLYVLLRRIGTSPGSQQRPDAVRAAAYSTQRASRWAADDTTLPGHLGTSLLNAYLTDCLEPSERARTDRHLTECSECATRLMKLRGAMRGDETPSPATLDRVRQRYRSPRPRRAGALLIARRGAGYDLAWQPPGSEDDLAATGSPAISTQPAARLARVGLWGRILGALVRDRSGRTVPTSTRSAQAGGAGVVTIALEEYVAEVRVEARERAPVLLVRVSESATRRPVARVEVAAEAKGTAGPPSMSDAEGRAEVTLPMGTMRISLRFGTTAEYIVYVIWA